MAGKPQVTLTFAGDSTKLESAFDKVGASAKKMDTSVGQASKKVGESADGFDRAGEAADGTYSKFDALESVGRGTGDTMAGLSEIMKGNVLQGSTDLAGGIAALADGFSGALLPAIKAMTTSSLSNAAQTVRTTAATVASKVATFASAVATNAMTVAQKALNLAMRMNPIGLVITAVLLLVGAIIYAYKHSETFRRIVDGAFRAVKTAAQFAFNWVKDNWKLLLGIVTGPIGLAVLVIGKHKDSILGFFKGIPKAIGGFFSGLASTISRPFSAAFAGIKSAWNNTVGGKGFSVPGWIPGLGGKDFRIPYFHTGGIVSGAMGSETLAVLKAGERVTGGRNGSGGGTIVIQSGGSRMDDLLVELLRKAIKIQGGDVQVVLGS